MQRFRSDSRLFRLAVCLLAALQIVAVSWHVCEMGGKTSHCHTASSADASAANASNANVPNAASPTILSCHSPEDAARAARMAWHAPENSALNCLAALLSATPTQIAQTFEVAPIALVVAVRSVAVTRGVSRAALRCIFARGPPAS